MAEERLQLFAGGASGAFALLFQLRQLNSFITVAKNHRGKAQNLAYVKSIRDPLPFCPINDSRGAENAAFALPIGCDRTRLIVIPSETSNLLFGYLFTGVPGFP